MFGHFFKNVTAYRYELADDEVITEEELNQFVPKLKHIDIKPSQKEAFGFSSVTGYHNPDYLIHRIKSWYLLSVTVEEKKINKNKLDRRVAEKKRAEEVQRNLEPGSLKKEESMQIREQIYAEMLAEVEASEDYLNVLIDTENRWVFFSDGNARRIKRFASLMQKHFTGFRLSDFCTHGLELHLTNWLYNAGKSLPASIELEDSASLKSEQSSKAALSKQNLQSEEIITLINHGKKCLELSLSYLNRISFKLTSTCQLKSIKLSDVLLSNIEVVEQPESRIQELVPYWEAMCSELTSIFIWLEDLQNKPV